MRGGAMATPPNLGHVAMFAYIKGTLISDSSPRPILVAEA